ncbi:IS1182 family transposase [Variovorax paradoxus]|uniref:IS1182 family transposase n=1 Tax=Variovorax paradoxus TaxID=34073 RepID=UPI0029C80D83|nr:IS1182 family transposase [Variovorax paradoxus]WPH23098.1 IS1182 family transposase [Variovorax paradoxus]WPH23125.1 IS1182 family transposase [Variovorax paradoxus]
MMSPVRNQVELRPVDLDALLAPEHPARTVWAFVQAMDLAPLYARIKSAGSRGGAPAIDPAILVALWLWATIDGVGSAREVDRLCERDDVYRWICGGVGVNYHSLADFRTEHEAWLDAQLTRSITSLLDRRLVTLNVVAQDGLRVRAHAKASSFRRRDKLAELHAQAQAQVRALKRELSEDAGASARRKQAAIERAAREREQRLAHALATMDKLQRKPPAEPKAPRKAKRRSPGDDPPDGGGTAAKTEPEPRVSTTDAQARVMKMADGGFRPAFNAQLAVDVQTQLIASVSITNSGSDMGQMSPMHKDVRQRYATTPDHWLADGGFTKLDAIDELTECGTQPVVPPPRSRNREIDCLAPKDTDSAPQAHWRAFMTSEFAKDLYLWRGASVECANAQLRRRGLHRFNVHGMVKARAVLLWHALAHNLMRMRSLGIVSAG